MKFFLTFILALFLASGPLAAADETKGDAPTPGREAGQPTSDRTLGNDTETPLSQTTKVDGETSTRTPDANDKNEPKK